MKPICLKLTSLCVALLLLFCTAAPAFAEESSKKTNGDGNADQLTINVDANAEVGQTVTYSLYLSDAVEPIVGFELRLFYDSDCLEYQKSSLKFEKFDVVIYNEDIEGKIPMNCSSLTNLPSFEKKAQFVSASFKVKKAGDASITYFFTELYGENLEYLKRYKFTYDLEVDGKKVIKDATPPINQDPDTLNNNQGDFVNYADGMGEENSPLKPDEHAKIGSVVEKKVVEVTRTVSGGSGDGGSGGSFFNSPFFFAIAGVLVVGAIVAAVVIVSVKGKKEEE